MSQNLNLYFTFLEASWASTCGACPTFACYNDRLDLGKLSSGTAAPAMQASFHDKQDQKLR